MSKEWTGSHPQKFGKTKAQVIIQKNSETDIQGLYRDIDSGIERIKGRRHFSVEGCKKQFEWKPCFKKTEFEKAPQRETGVKKLTFIVQNPKERAERKHVTPTRKSVVKEMFNDDCVVEYKGSHTINNRIW